MVFETDRLHIRKAMTSDEDVEMFFRLWNHPKVMINVGFPNGLGISKERIVEQFQKQSVTEYDSRLIVIRKEGDLKIGECMLGTPDENGVSKTDVKLLPEFWNNGYGKEIKQGLVNYLFTNRTDCQAVKADPKKSNIASQKMQEYVRATRIENGEEYPIKNVEKYFPPEDHYLYLVFRKDWRKAK
ncbi:MAG: GNAT family protein [Candidatus Hatepunaea meridiana]|nr:GNAT family protein [Candidatus Hatepunaea meridiana]